ncbi:hypothetical protein M426DRAFT_26146 [Hypoxylon sp. CI-4A]|nr:hypothetical protein M426DRAFT_26146 [Hypoxylon sp. CI-4A]
MDTISLDKFPTELLALIFSNFCIHCRAEYEPEPPDAYFRGTQQQLSDPSWYSIERHALFSLSLTSRRFQYIAQGILYHEFMPGYGDSWRSERFTWNKRLVSFLRTVTHRTDLAALVKRIYIHPNTVHAVNEVDAHLALEETASKFRISLPNFLDSCPDANMQVPAHGPPQIYATRILAMLLIILPNLTHLSLQVLGTSPNISSTALKAAGVSKLRLKTLDICARSLADTEGRYMFRLGNEGEGILLLARDLETVNLHMCGHAWLLPTKLRTLRITHSRLSNNDLRMALCHFTGLETFVYEAAFRGFYGISNWSEPRYPTDWGAHFDPADAVRHLENNRATLKHLHIDFRDSDVVEKFSSIPSLSGFTALEVLFLNPRMIYAYKEEEQGDRQKIVQLLPSNITKIQLAGKLFNDIERLVKGLLGLANALSQGLFPRLKQIRCDPAEDLDRYGVGEALANAGVDFGYETYPLSDATLLPSDVPPPDDPVLYIPMPDSDSDDDI